MSGWCFKKQGASQQVEGEVKSSWAYQQDKAIMIVSLLWAGELRVKIIEGLAMGDSVISKFAVLKISSQTQINN